MRSNFDLNPFPGRARAAIYTSRKDFYVYRLYQGQNSEERLHIEAQKIKKFDFSENLHFSSSEAFSLSLKCFFHHSFMFSVTRRAGWSHPNSKSNTVAGKS